MKTLATLVEEMNEANRMANVWCTLSTNGHEFALQARQAGESRDRIKAQIEAIGATLKWDAHGYATLEGDQ